MRRDLTDDFACEMIFQKNAIYLVVEFSRVPHDREESLWFDRGGVVDIGSSLSHKLRFVQGSGLFSNRRLEATEQSQSYFRVGLLLLLGFL